MKFQCQSKPTTGNKSLYEIINDNGVRGVNTATSQNLTVKSIIYLDILTERLEIKLTIF
jgi:hypothetical protein